MDNNLRAICFCYSTLQCILLSECHAQENRTLNMFISKEDDVHLPGIHVQSSLSTVFYS